MKDLVLTFDETGGYDSMTGAWVISHEPSGNTLVVVDQRDYGQNACDYTYRSAEAERVALAILATLTDLPEATQ